MVKKINTYVFVLMVCECKQNDMFSFVGHGYLFVGERMENCGYNFFIVWFDLSLSIYFWYSGCRAAVHPAEVV